MKKRNIILALLMSLVAFASTAKADDNVIVVTDIDKAIAEKWVVTFRVDGQYLYGSDFQNCLMGDGVTKDKAEAIKWYRKAAEQGQKGAIEALKNLQ